MSCFNSYGNILCDGKERGLSLYKIAKTEFLCDDTGSSLVLKGQHIKFSEFIKDDGKLGFHCNSPIKSLSILATDEVTIDRNLRAPGMKVYVLAPLWTIIGSRKINLNGLEHPKGPRYSKPAKKTVKTVDGEAGDPGLAGYLGGDFVGIGDVFIDGESLTISVSGSDGQDGQDGGDGGDGEDGEYADKDRLDLNCFIAACGVEPIEVQVYSITGKKQTFTCTGTSSGKLSKDCAFTIKGRNGRPSGSGGNSGSGGKPGNPGNIRLFELKGVKSGINTINSVGRAGKDGEPGMPGKPGSNGRDARYELRSYVGLASTDPEISYLFNDIANGVEGKVGTKVNVAAAHKRLVLSDIAHIVVEYKGHLLDNLNLSDSSDNKVEFYNNLDKNMELMSLFDTSALVKELRILETSFHKRHATFDFLPLYQSLSNRTVVYAKQPKSLSKSSAEHKKVLTYLYTTILSREYNLKDRSESNLIVEIGEYLKLVQESIAKYKASNKIHKIEEYKKNYEVNIERKTQEAHELISSEIMPELELIMKENVKNVELTLGKIIYLEDQTQAQIDELTKNKIEFEKKMAMSLFCDLLSIVGTFVSILPGFGGLVGKAIGVVAGVLDSELGVQDGDLHIPPQNNVLEGAEALGGTVEGFRKQAETDLRERIEFSIASLTEYSDEFDDLLREIYDIKNKLSKVTDMQGISQLSEELRKVVQKSQDQNLEESNYNSKIKLPKRPQTKKPKLIATTKSKTEFNEPKITTIPHTRASATSKPKTEYKKSTIPNITKKPGTQNQKPTGKTKERKLKILSTALSVGEKSFAIFQKYSKNKEHLEQLSEAIQRKKEYLSQLRKHEDAVKKEMGPALEVMASNLLNTANSLGTKSQVSLDVIKWKIQSNLKNMQLGINSMVQGLNVSDNFKNTFAKIEAALNTLIGVYDRIQGFKDQQNLGNYIADINSAGSNLIDVTDPKLRKDLDYLNVIIDCNTVIQQYQTAVDAFKQYVFPFADLFFRELVLPQNLNYGEDLNGLVIKAETQITHMKKKYDEYRFVAKRYDSYIGTGSFNSNYRSTKPFFVWNYKTYHKMISKLLSGRKVIVLADVKKSTPRYDAVKFNQVEINFKANDKKTQLALNDVLNDFKISARHMGDSYFRVNDEFFLVTTGTLEFWYTYEKDHNGQPVRQAGLLQKIKNSVYMLSPYATWELQLTHSSEMNRQAFHVLNKYKKLVDVELIGHGHFVSKDKLDIDIKINQYYSPLYRNYTPW